MAEINEIEDIPQSVGGQGASSSQQESQPKNQDLKTTTSGPASGDKHIPQFDFNGYPMVSSSDQDGMMSPRIGDDTW